MILGGRLIEERGFKDQSSSLSLLRASLSSMNLKNPKATMA
jgi:hypothetical protein